MSRVKATSIFSLRIIDARAIPATKSGWSRRGDDFSTRGTTHLCMPSSRQRLSSARPNATGASVDIGCGDGYFTAALAAVGPRIYGIDVSKAAIRAAAKRHPSIAFAVASSKRLPLMDAAFDAATAILAPIDADAVRVLANDGVLVRVSPGPEHLRELRALVYADVRPHRRAARELPGLEHAGEHLLEFAFDTDPMARADLIAMTPLLHRTREDQRRARLAREHLTIEAGFWIDVFRKRN